MAIPCNPDFHVASLRDASLDNIYFSEHRLYDLATEFSLHGGKYLFLDEVHKYPNWSQELKNIYDGIPELSVAFTGSSLLSLKDGNADLSRRVVMHDIYGLSYREYAMLSRNEALPNVSYYSYNRHRSIVGTEYVFFFDLSYFVLSQWSSLYLWAMEY